MREKPVCPGCGQIVTYFQIDMSVPVSIAAHQTRPDEGTSGISLSEPPSNVYPSAFASYTHATQADCGQCGFGMPVRAFWTWENSADVQEAASQVDPRQAQENMRILGVSGLRASRPEQPADPEGEPAGVQLRGAPEVEDVGGKAYSRVKRR